MLVSFSVQNYRSFASRQTISMVAGVGSKRKERVSFSSGNSHAPNLLRSACLFGANGAGKSALVRAFKFYREFAIASAKNMQEGEKINVSPFKFDKKWAGQPTEFEATFIHGDALYQYGFAVDTQRVWSEWLFSKPNASDTKMRTLFQREYDDDNGVYVWNINKTYVKGEKELWKNSTRDNALFLSTAIQLKAETFKDPFNWIQEYLRPVGAQDRISSGFTAHQCVVEGWQDKVLNLLHAVDLQIKDLSFDVRNLEQNDLADDGLLGKSISESKESLEELKIVRIKSYHQGADGELVPLGFEEESDGTQVLFSLAGPWLDVLKNGYTLVVDELHNSLHPLALKFLVNLFHDPEINTNKAQLIFTSHETSVMAKDFMHQDQVWLVENNNIEGSSLIPLSDYKVRDGLPYQKPYLDGRYGAVPKLRGFVDG